MQRHLDLPLQFPSFLLVHTLHVVASTEIKGLQHLREQGTSLICERTHQVILAASYQGVEVGLVVSHDLLADLVATHVGHHGLLGGQVDILVLLDRLPDALGVRPQGSHWQVARVVEVTE